MNRLINISGGAIKFVGLVACLRQLIKSGVVPSVMTGVSSGAIIAFCFCCGKLEEAFEMGKKTDDVRLIFSKRNDPTRTWNIIRNLMLGRNYLGEMDNLEKNIKNVVTEYDFNKYKHGIDSIDCFILSINEKDGSKVMVNLKNLEYNQAIDHVIGSSSISPTTKSRETILRGLTVNLIDGGHRDHSAGSEALGIEDLNLDECLTIWSRDKPSRYMKEALREVSSLPKRLMNSVIPMFVKEMSVNDEERERILCERKGIDYFPIYLKKFHSSTYHISKAEIERGIHIGITAAKIYTQTKES